MMVKCGVNRFGCIKHLLSGLFITLTEDIVDIVINDPFIDISYLVYICVCVLSR